MAHGPIPDKPEENDAELAMRITLGLPVPDSMIDPDRHPGLRESIAYAGEIRDKEAAMQARIDRRRREMAGNWATVIQLAAEQSSWRKHPIRRFNAKRQEVQIDIGEWMLETFPFLRPPAEWLVERLDRIVRKLW